MVEQGEIIRVVGITPLLIVVSKNSFNKTGSVVVCPVINENSSATLSVSTEYGTVVCDSMKRLDLKSRYYSKIGRISLGKTILISDMLQSIFEYI